MNWDVDPIPDPEGSLPIHLRCLICPLPSLRKGLCETCLKIIFVKFLDLTVFYLKLLLVFVQGCRIRTRIHNYRIYLKNKQSCSYRIHKTVWACECCRAGWAPRPGQLTAAILCSAPRTRPSSTACPLGRGARLRCRCWTSPSSGWTRRTRSWWAAGSYRTSSGIPRVSGFPMLSVADPGCLSRIPDPDFYPSRIQEQQQKREVKKN